MRAPPLSHTWLPLTRWRPLYFGKWRETEHTNINETRAIVGLLRHLARSSRCWGSRVLVLTDSMVALGALGKGRSSAPALLRLCRQAAAITLAFRIYGSYRYVPSEVNVADGLSRGGFLGAAPETVLAHSDRAAPMAPSAAGALPLGHELRALGHACAGFAGG